MATELERLISKEEITIDVKPGTGTSPPLIMQQMTARGWVEWDVILKYRSRRMKVPFFVQRGYEPNTFIVIYTLCQEARSIEAGTTFEAWATRGGFNPDSRLDYMTWEGIMKTTTRFKKFLSRKYKEFLSAKHG